MKSTAAVVVGAASLLALVLTACPGAKVPSGPPPEYEVPPPPSWVRDAGDPTPAPPVLNPVPPDDAGANKPGA